MKQMIIVFVLSLFSCSYGSRSDWDSGARARQDNQQQRMEEMSENVNNQFPTSRPGTENDQPF